jgi:hypothetical protein
MSLKHLVLSLLLAAPLAAMAAPAAPQAAAELDRATAQIRSRAQLDDYLAGNHASGNPLAALSPAARERFVASLQFGPKGVASAVTADLEDELGAAQAYRVLALFGLQTALVGMPGLRVESDEDRAVDAWRNGVVLPQYFLLDEACTGGSWRCEPQPRAICWIPCPLS